MNYIYLASKNRYLDPDNFIIRTYRAIQCMLLDNCNFNTKLICFVVDNKCHITTIVAVKTFQYNGIWCARVYLTPKVCYFNDTPCIISVRDQGHDSYDVLCTDR